MINQLTNKLISTLFQNKSKLKKLDYLDDQDLTRFNEQDIILENEEQIQEFLPEVLGQALARTWVDKRFLDAFNNFPIEILERGGVYLPDHISVEFIKEAKTRPRVVVYENTNKTKKTFRIKTYNGCRKMNLKFFWIALLFTTSEMLKAEGHDAAVAVENFNIAIDLVEKKNFRDAVVIFSELSKQDFLRHSIICQFFILMVWVLPKILNCLCIGLGRPI